MFKSMLKKECVELAAPFLLAVASLVLLVGDAVIDSNRHLRAQGNWMLDDDFVYPFLMISLVLAAIMGLIQSLSEDVQGTWRYVLALPGGWRRILTLKIGVGAAVWLCWGVVSTAICGLGVLVNAGPAGESWFRLADPLLRILVCVPVVYCGAFLTGLRRANWFFSRLAPGIGVMLCWFILPYLPQWWIVAPLVTAGFAALLISVMFHEAAHRDFA